MDISIQKTQLKIQLQETLKSIDNGPHGQIYLELQECNFAINQVINFREDCEYKLSMVHTIHQYAYFRENILQNTSSTPNRTTKITQYKYHNISEFIKINESGQIALTRKAKGLLRLGRIDVVGCIISEIEHLCDNYFYMSFMVKIHSALCMNKKMIFRSSSIAKLQKNLESYIVICSQIQKYLEKKTRYLREYLDTSTIKPEIDYVSNLRLQMWLLDC